MLLRLAEHLQIPLRERNLLLNAAGFAAEFPERPFAGAALGVVRKAIEVVLEGHEPFPAFAVDRHWTLIASNGGFRPFLVGIDPALLRAPVNVLRLTLNPGGLGPRLANYHQWRSHVLNKLRGQLLASGDPVLLDLLHELRDYPAPIGVHGDVSSSSNQEWHSLVVPFQLATETGVLSFYSTTTVFGTPLDLTLAEISLESFYPADAATAAAVRKAAAAKAREQSEATR